MWILLSDSGLSCSYDEASKDSFVFVCSKCTRLRDLEARLCVSVVDASVQCSESSVVPSCRASVPKSCCTCVGVQVSGVMVDASCQVYGSVSFDSSFVVLDSVDDDVESLCSEDVSVPGGDIPGSGVTGDIVSNESAVDQEVPTGKVIWIGDSLVRHVDREFCSPDRRNRVRVCLPGARIDDVLFRVESMCSESDLVIISIGTNDVPRGSLSDIRRRYLDLLFRLKDIGCRVLVLGLLPRRGGPRLIELMRVLNDWLSSYCFLFGFQFAEFWEKFSSRPDWFLGDGLHLTRVGAGVLAREVNRLISRSLN